MKNNTGKKYGCQDTCGMGDKPRTFQPTLTDKFLVREVVGRPVHLICNKLQTKQSNISRSFNSAHGNLGSRFPPGSERHKDRVQKIALKRSYCTQSQTRSWAGEGYGTIHA